MGQTIYMLIRLGIGIDGRILRCITVSLVRAVNVCGNEIIRYLNMTYGTFAFE